MDRSHKQRLIIGFLGAPLILLAAWFGNWWFLALICVIAAFSVYELLKLIHYPPRVLMIVALVMTPLCLLAMYRLRLDLVVLILVFTAIFTNISLLFYKKSEYLKMSFVGIGSIIYPGLCLGTMILLRNLQFNGTEIGRNIVITLIIGVFATDIAAFYIGKLFGKTPLFPSVSPKKTREGAVAGFLFCTVFMIFLWARDFVPFFGFIDYLVVALCAGIFGQLGDLVESKIKREIGVKDSSNILLEHGGFLDRFDSLSVTAPLFWIYVYIKFFL
ncbi:MAG: phosphatidate cytidylyltransferase [Candidatus Neomarinimicrobiota bacterium]|jgi:phosphatidate cytidylyltransferase|nr:phosphatidate cytidylyltransferase [Candidatus Neomarinimicrobiota bacterium]MDX9780599.1 phosphatidate cytidylyltransferase [bacterium]